MCLSFNILNSYLLICLFSSIKLSFVKRCHRSFTSPQFMASFTEVSLYSLHFVAVGDRSTLLEKKIARNKIHGHGASQALLNTKKTYLIEDYSIIKDQCFYK